MILLSLGRLRPYRFPGRHRLPRSAVAVVCRRGTVSDWEMLFIERARRLGDPWSGHMAFPGGRMQPGDVSAWHAAVRETQEETGIDLQAHGLAIRRLRDLLTRRHNRLLPMVVTPYLFELLGDPPMNPNHEVESLLWVPWSYLRNKDNLAVMRWRMGGFSVPMPCYEYAGKCIWGLSFMMIQDLLADGALDGISAVSGAV